MTTATFRYLGQGWSFPVAPDPVTGGLDSAEGPEKVRESIWIVLDTEPGERVMRPTFGCGLRLYLMQPNSVSTRALISHDVETALTLWEPRIKLTSVDVLPDDEDPSLVLIAISYIHVRDGSRANLVYPFSLE
jgi:phage baseplate assembly protein W